MLLDSGELINEDVLSAEAVYRRHDILTALPSAEVTFSDSHLNISEHNTHRRITTKQPFEILRELLSKYKPSSGQNTQHKEIPFSGGLLGYMSYDFGKDCLTDEPNATKKKDSMNLTDDLNIPYLKMGIYQWALITDHCAKSTHLYNFGLEKAKWLEIKQLITHTITEYRSEDISSHQTKIDQFKNELTFEQYSTAFHKIKNYIYAGDCYQVNYAQRFSAKISGPIYPVYQKLAIENNSPFSAFLNFEDFQILSLSPERFIASDEDIVVTQPIKGTIPRSSDPQEDSKRAEQLISSEKDKAENLMIVDLLRNDLSKTAAKDSVQVTELFGHYKFESVHHLISTVVSKLESGLDNFDLLATTLPGGSITGAPKIRAMQIIDELEFTQRGIYCGIIGYLDFNGKMDTNICIRTLVAKNDYLYCWAGGGLVADSTLESEYQETFDKLNKILPVLSNQNISESDRVNIKSRQE